MHLVFVTSLIPDDNPMSGYDIANAAILEGLQRLGVAVTLLGFCWTGHSRAAPDGSIVLGEIDPRTDHASTVQKLKWLGRAVAQGQTFASAKLQIVEPETIRAHLQGLPRYDAYLLNSVQMAGAYPELFRDRPSIFVAHNVEHVSALENAAAAKTTFERLLYRREATMLRDVEASLATSANRVLTFSKEDAEAFCELASVEADVLPLTTGRSTRTDQGPRSDGAACDAALIGNWGWAPNRIGMDWFLGEVAPRLPADFTVQIAGARPADLRSDRPNIRFVGRVDDAARFVESASMVPLIARAGTGVQLKTIETFELGLPSVATTSSLRGVSAVPDNCVVEDDPERFAAAMVWQARDGTRLSGSVFAARQEAERDDVLGRAIDAVAAKSSARTA